MLLRRNVGVPSPSRVMPTSQPSARESGITWREACAREFGLTSCRHSPPASFQFVPKKLFFLLKELLRALSASSRLADDVAVCLRR